MIFCCPLMTGTAYNRTSEEAILKTLLAKARPRRGMGLAIIGLACLLFTALVENVSGWKIREVLNGIVAVIIVSAVWLLFRSRS